MKQNRERAIERVKRQLLRKSSPRMQMMLILSITGGVGFLISFALLHIGLKWMWLRYPISILLAYCVFLLILRFWLFAHSRERESGLDFDESILEVDASVVDLLPSGGGSSGTGITSFGGGGDFGGGGGGGSFGEALNSASTAPTSSGGGGSGGGGIFDLDLDDGWLIILAVIAILGALFASFYVVYIAPELLAEILVDGLLVTGLYKRVQGLEERNWLGTAVRKTLLPALIVALLFSIAGYLFQKAVPDAHSIGDVWTSRTSEKR